MFDSMITAQFAAYLVLAIAPMLAWSIWSRRRQRVALEQWHETLDEGTALPTSLHPVIDPAKCLGCGTCVDACPEGKVIGLVDGMAELVDPSGCIGHGACQRACPNDAIHLVFGTRERGVDIPRLQADFQTTVPGVFVAGELGGMGLVRNAVEQGKQAIAGVAEYCKSCAECETDVVIVGAGPAGLAATLAAKQRGLRHVTLEQDRIGGTVAHFPRGKVVMTAPVELPLYGTLDFREISKEALLAAWHEIVASTGIEVREQTRLTDLARHDGLIDVCTQDGVIRTRAVVLALGRRGTPRTLGVPGEDLPKVTYALADPAQYIGQRVLVVGGGDSAIEAALAIAEQANTSVRLSYRGRSFSRAKSKNRRRIDSPPENLTVMLETQVEAFEPERVRIRDAGGESEWYANDATIVCAGGLLPTPLLERVGVEFRTHYGEIEKAAAA